MAISSSPLTHLIPVDPRVYCETMNELHSYITSSKRGYLTQAELFRYYRQRHDNTEIPYRLLGYRSLLDLLSSDQRLFTIDLRREPAYVYSAVKLRQQRRERRQGNTIFLRQHHSTNTLEEQRIMPPDYVFLDHHVPFNEQHYKQPNLELADEQEPTSETNNQHTIKSISNNSIDTIIWHTPQLDEEGSIIEIKNDLQENHSESTKVISDQYLPLPIVSTSSPIDDNRSWIKFENHHKPILQKFLSENDHTDEYKRSPSVGDEALIKFSSSLLNRSISTSTTSLSKSYSLSLIDSYIFLFTISLSFVFLGIYLFKLC